MNKKLWVICLKWGALLGACLGGLELIKMVARQIDYGNTQVMDIAMIIGYILILYTAVKEFKEYYPARLSFPKAFLACLLVSLFGSVVLFGYDMFHYAIIEKDGLQNKHEVALQNFRKAIEKDTVTNEELTFYVDTVKKMTVNQEQKVLVDNNLQDSIADKVQKGLDMIIRFYEEKITLQRSTDTANHYQLGNFSAFGRQVLIETLSIYVSQNEEESSTRYVQDIIKNVNVQLQNVNVADMRYEMNKSHVPHYEKPGRYAAISAFMDMVYGMFFGLFIAMFHYRSKNPIEDIQPAYTGRNNDDEVEEEDPEENPKID